MKRAPLASILVVLLAATPCTWDSDTLCDELRGLPEALRLVTGRWMRHGAEYYAARIAKQPAALSLLRSGESALASSAASCTGRPTSSTTTSCGIL